VEYLPKHLQHEHSNAVFCWFTLDAITEAKEMGWGKHLQQLISQNAIDLKADLKPLDFDCFFLNQKPTKIDLTNGTPVNMDNLSLPSFQAIGVKATVSHPAGLLPRCQNPPVLPISLLPQ